MVTNWSACLHTDVLGAAFASLRPSALVSTAEAAAAGAGKTKTSSTTNNVHNDDDDANHTLNVLYNTQTQIYTIVFVSITVEKLMRASLFFFFFLLFVRACHSEFVAVLNEINEIICVKALRDSGDMCMLALLLCLDVVWCRRRISYGQSSQSLTLYKCVFMILE